MMFVVMGNCFEFFKYKDLVYLCLRKGQIISKSIFPIKPDLLNLYKNLKSTLLVTITSISRLYFHWFLINRRVTL
jgi:hypothetical protein